MDAGDGGQYILFVNEDTLAERLPATGVESICVLQDYDPRMNVGVRVTNSTC